jgi:hypothetical protein
MDYNGQTAQVGGEKTYEDLPDGFYQGKIESAEFKEGSKKVADCAMFRAVCVVVSGPMEGRRCELFSYAKGGDTDAIRRLGNALAGIGYEGMRLENAMDVFCDAEAHPVGRIIEIKVSTGKQGGKFNNPVRMIAERGQGDFGVPAASEQRTPFDNEPKAPESDFPF